MERFLGGFKCETAQFNTCAFQMKERTRSFKPGQWSGKLEGIHTLKRKCSCPKFYKHETLVGKNKTAKAAEYPSVLAMEVARMVVKAFRTTLELEWWRHKEKTSKEELSKAKQQWATSKAKNNSGRPVDIEVQRVFV